MSQPEGNIKSSSLGPKRAFLRKHSTVIVYICLLLVLCTALGLDRLNRQQDAESRCRSGTDSRNVQRATVDAVFNLAAGSLIRNSEDPPLTDKERQQYNQYIRRLNNFRDNMYTQIKPSEACEPYVDDVDVKPPTPPIAPIPRSS